MRGNLKKHIRYTEQLVPKKLRQTITSASGLNSGLKQFVDNIKIFLQTVESDLKSERQSELNVDNIDPVSTTLE